MLPNRMIKNRWLQGLLLAFCCGHALVILGSIVSPLASAAFKSEGQKPAHPALDLYQLMTAGRQEWNMFETIPKLHAMDVRLEGQNERGELIKRGSVLPGLRSYPRPEGIRYYNAYFRLLSSEKYREAYLRRLAQTVPAVKGPEDGRDWALVVDAEYTRHLFHIRRDGHVSLLATERYELPMPADDPR
jgi:hypothetical protein